MPASSVHMPAVPGAVIATCDESVAVSFTTPFTDATSCTGPAPLTLSEIVAQLDRKSVV